MFVPVLRVLNHVQLTTVQTNGETQPVAPVAGSNFLHMSALWDAPSRKWSPLELFALPVNRSLAGDSGMLLDHDAFYHARMERYAYSKSRACLFDRTRRLTGYSVAVAVFLGYEYCAFTGRSK